MDWREKLSKLVVGRNKSMLSRDAGLPPNAIDSALNRGQEPRASRAIAIAAAVNVSPAWLWNNDLEWPPPRDSGISEVSDTELVKELANRRDKIIAEIGKVAEHLDDDDALDRLNSIAGRASSLSETESETDNQIELQNGVKWIVRLWSLENELSWLSVDSVFPPRDEVPLSIRSVFDGGRWHHLERACRDTMRFTPHTQHVSILESVRPVPELARRQRAKKQKTSTSKKR